MDTHDPDESGERGLAGRRGASGGADQTLGARLAQHDASAFVGRAAELSFLERHLTEDPPPASVVFLHGPRGIGKSALLRELARHAQRRGFIPCWIDGREVSPLPGSLEDRLAVAMNLPGPVVILDSFERIAGAAGQLRRTLLPSLPAPCLVVIASRTAPDEGWFQGSWEADFAELEIGPLPDAEATALVRARGVAAGRAADLVAWAGGSPHELTLAAELAAGDPSWSPETTMGDARLVDFAVRRLAGDEIEDDRRDTLAVAAIARRVTVPLLRDVLPDQSAPEAFEWLRQRSFVEGLNGSLSLHQLAREVLRADLRRRDPERERDLRRRITDHLYARAKGGDARFAIDLSCLIETPTIRWGYSWEEVPRVRLDEARPGDADAFESALRGTRHEALWPGSKRFFERAPEHVGVARDRHGEPAGYAVAVTPATAPSFSADDEVLGPRIEHARGLGEQAGTVVFRDVVDVTRGSSLRVRGALGVDTLRRAAGANPRYTYLAIDPRLVAGREFAAALEARHLSELDAVVGESCVECHLVDHGPGGMLAHARELVYRELGLPPPTRQPEPVDVPQAVREALRNLQRPDLLTRSELARGEDVEERARYVRGLLAEAAERAFGKGPSEDLMRRVLVRSYLDPAPTRELAAEEVSLSRSAYFRRLREASERVASYVARRLGP